MCDIGMTSFWGYHMQLSSDLIFTDWTCATLVWYHFVPTFIVTVKIRPYFQRLNTFHWYGIILCLYCYNKGQTLFSQTGHMCHWHGIILFLYCYSQDLTLFSQTVDTCDIGSRMSVMYSLCSFLSSSAQSLQMYRGGGLSPE